ncbi:MAG: alpha/beta hydrolase [Verrucomicrobia bacterium]|nr:alpha/beta hydrolase [Verrucomicrobiota bacterium]
MIRVSRFLAAALWLAAAQAHGAEPVLLWPDGAPGALGAEDKDRPTLTPFAPEPMPARCAAMVVCPGGGYLGLAGYEGKDYALYLNQAGVTAFVLQYRLGSHGYRHPRMLEDAARAVRWVRAHAAEWHVDPQRVGIMGSSAGGHLASTLLTRHDAGKPEAADPVERESSRPDLGILCYAVISMRTELTHEGSRRALLGPAPGADLLWALSNELQVTPDTPPCFLWHTWEDRTVKVENALEFAAALRRAGVPFELHIYQKGAHGVALGDAAPFRNPHPWTRDLAHWLRAQRFIDP